MLPLELASLGIAGIAFLTLVDPPTAVWAILVTPISFCFMAFGLSGIGWFQFGYRREGCAIFIVKALIAIGLVFFLGRSIHLNCDNGCRVYSSRTILVFWILFWASIALPFVSTVALLVNLVTRGAIEPHPAHPNPTQP